MVSILIDSGSTHNFIKVGVAHKLKLPVSSVTQFSVVTGSGNELSCDKICKDVKVLVQGTILGVDLYLLLMDGMDVVMGIQWLKTAGKDHY